MALQRGGDRRLTQCAPQKGPTRAGHEKGGAGDPVVGCLGLLGVGQQGEVHVVAHLCGPKHMTARGRVSRGMKMTLARNRNGYGAPSSVVLRRLHNSSFTVMRLPATTALEPDTDLKGNRPENSCIGLIDYGVLRNFETPRTWMVLM